MNNKAVNDKKKEKAYKPELQCVRVWVQNQPEKTAVITMPLIFAMQRRFLKYP